MLPVFPIWKWIWVPPVKGQIFGDSWPCVQRIKVMDKKWCHKPIPNFFLETKNYLTFTQARIRVVQAKRKISTYNVHHDPSRPGTKIDPMQNQRRSCRPTWAFLGSFEYGSGPHRLTLSKLINNDKTYFETRDSVSCDLRMHPVELQNMCNYTCFYRICIFLTH